MPTFAMISADSHVVEPPNLWLDYLEPAYRERAPRVERISLEDSEPSPSLKTRGALRSGDVFVCENLPFIPVGLIGAAFKDPADYQVPGTYEEDTLPGAYDPAARVGEIEADGVQGEVLYPSVASTMFQHGDVGFKQALFRAYNSWLADYCAVHPDRFKGVAQIAVEDVSAAVVEIERAAKLGLGGIGVPVRLHVGATYSDRAFDPIWAAAQAASLPVSLHVGTNVQPVAANTAAMAGDNLGSLVIQSYFCADAMHSVAELLLGNVFGRFPDLKVVVAEYELSWAAYFMQRLDLLFERRMTYMHIDFPRDLPPSEYFRRNVYLTFMRDAPGVQIRDFLGGDNVMWSTDYPHTDSTYPNTEKLFATLCADLPEPDRRKLAAENASALYRF